MLETIWSIFTILRWKEREKRTPKRRLILLRVLMRCSFKNILKTSSFHLPRSYAIPFKNYPGTLQSPKRSDRKRNRKNRIKSESGEVHCFVSGSNLFEFILRYVRFRFRINGFMADLVFLGIHTTFRRSFLRIFLFGNSTSLAGLPARGGRRVGLIPIHTPRWREALLE